MSLVSTGDILEVRFVCQHTEQVSYNVRHFRVAQVSGQSVSLAEIVNDLATQYEPDYKNLICAEAQYLGMDIRRVWPTKTVLYNSTVGAGPGTIAGEILPTQVAGLITLRSETPGPGGRGRMYIPFPSEADNDENGRPEGNYLQRLAFFAALMVEQQFPAGPDGSATLDPVVWSRTTQTHKMIVDSVRRTKWATQRRRGGFGKPNTPPF